MKHRKLDAASGIKHRRPRMKVLFLIAILGMMPLSHASYSYGSGKIRERDTTGDGNIDQRAHFSRSGVITLLEIDTDGDLKMDSFQHYRKGELVKIDRDLDFDGLIDSEDLFLSGKRHTHLKYANPGHEIVEIIHFNDRELVEHIEKDSTGDTRFDTEYFFIDGKLSRAVRDTDGDSMADLWISYHNDLPRQQWADRDNDGIIESRIQFDAEGRPLSSDHDGDGDAIYEEQRRYLNGEIIWQGKDEDLDEFYEVVTVYEGGQPRKQSKDSNRDSEYDVITTFRDGVVSRQEMDRDFNRKMDWFCEFGKDGKVLKVVEDSNENGVFERTRKFKAGEIAEVLDDPDEDGFQETVTSLEDGQPVLQEQDTNEDDRMDVFIEFGRGGLKKKASIDSDFNDQPDTWEYFQKGELLRVEQDPGEAGWIKFCAHYQRERKVRMEMDRDGDGRFESVEYFDVDGWDSVTEHDRDGDGFPEERVCSTGGVVRLRELDENSDGKIDLQEIFGDGGEIQTLREDFSGSGRLDLEWSYNGTAEPVLAVQDADGDDKADIWYHYANGRVTAVEEDCNHDGMIDLWERYDAAELLVERARDYNGDGEPDVWEQM